MDKIKDDYDLEPKELVEEPNYFTDDTTVSRVHKMERRYQVTNKDGRCTHCPPHKGENAKYKKHGIRKPRYKD